MAAVNGIRCVDTGDHVSAGNVLQWENTQPWSVCAVIRLLRPLTMGAVLITSADSSPWPFPIEILVTCAGQDLTSAPTGRLCARISSSFPDNAISDYGSTNLMDGRTHHVWATYDGSKSAAGVNLYVDGNLETMTAEYDSLTGSSLNGNPLYLGAQKNGSSDNHQFECFGAVRISDIARDATYIAANHSLSSPPDVDENTVLAYDFDEQTGTTCNDLSANGYDGTLTSDGLWATFDPEIPLCSVSEGAAVSASPLSLSITGVASGSLLVVGVATYNTGITVSVSDGTDDFMQAGSYAVNGGNRMSIWYLANVSAGNKTITIRPSAAAYMSANVIEVSSTSLSPLDGTSTATGSSATPSAGTVSVSGSGEIVYCLAGMAAIVTAVGVDPLEKIGEITGNNFENAAFGVASVSAALSPGFTFSGSNPWACAGASFILATTTTPVINPLGLGLDLSQRRRRK